MSDHVTAITTDSSGIIAEDIRVPLHHAKLLLTGIPPQDLSVRSDILKVLLPQGRKIAHTVGLCPKDTELPRTFSIASNKVSTLQRDLQYASANLREAHRLIIHAHSQMGQRWNKAISAERSLYRKLIFPSNSAKISEVFKLYTVYSSYFEQFQAETQTAISELALQMDR